MGPAPLGAAKMRVRAALAIVFLGRLQAATAISGSCTLCGFASQGRGSMERNFMRALCSCDLLLPMEQPSISAISLCS